MIRKVLHKQIYKPTPFGNGQINTTICGRVRNDTDYNHVADTDAEMTCFFCLKIMADRREKGSA
jgi:hypothetical protein